MPSSVVARLRAAVTASTTTTTTTSLNASANNASPAATTSTSPTHHQDISTSKPVSPHNRNRPSIVTRIRSTIQLSERYAVPSDATTSGSHSSKSSNNSSGIVDQRKETWYSACKSKRVSIDRHNGSLVLPSSNSGSSGKVPTMTSLRQKPWMLDQAAFTNVVRSALSGRLRCGCCWQVSLISARSTIVFLLILFVP